MTTYGPHCVVLALSLQPVSTDIRPGFAMATSHTVHSLPPAPPPLTQQGSNEHAAPPPSPAPPTSGTNHLAYITPIPNRGTHVDPVDGSDTDSTAECPFSPLSPLFPEEVNWTMSVLYGGKGHDSANDDSCAEPPLSDDEVSIHESVVSSDGDPVTYIDDVSSQSDGDEKEGCVMQPVQPGDLSYRGGYTSWSSDADNPALRFSFTLHDIPEAEEDRESEGEGESPRRRAPPNQLTLPPNMSALSAASSEHSFSTRPPSLPHSPAPGELMSPTLDALVTNSPRYTALFDTFTPVESPIHEFDAILRELSKSISLDRIVSGDYPSPPTSAGSTDMSTKEGDFQSVVRHLRGEGGASASPPLMDEEAAEGPFPRQRKISNESASSQMKVSRSLDYLSEVVSFMERFSMDEDEQEMGQQEVGQQEVGQQEVSGEVVHYLQTFLLYVHCTM